jgi:hypothetical protein
LLGQSRQLQKVSLLLLGYSGASAGPERLALLGLLVQVLLALVVPLALVLLALVVLA